MKTLELSLISLTISSLLCGCGTNGNPCVTGNSFVVSPYSSTNVANHASAAPANQVRFVAASGVIVLSGSGCAVPNVMHTVPAAWTTSDPKDVIISSASDDTNGTATCVNATDGPVTVTATAPVGATVYTPKTASTTLTCK
jgi:hypothetical protein